jgi:hypothetical protein
MDLRGWNVIDEERAVLWREYAFTKGAYATTFVFRGTDGLVVVSPGKGLEAADYDVLSQFGEVRALIANNTFHHLGQGPWRERMNALLAEDPPAIIVPAHGPAVMTPNLVAEARAQIARL